MSKNESLRLIRELRRTLKDYLLDYEPPDSDREWGTIDGLEIAIEETMRLDEKEVRSMTEPTKKSDHFQSEVEQLTAEYYETGVPAWVLSVCLESVAEDMQRKANRHDRVDNEND